MPKSHILRLFFIFILFCFLIISSGNCFAWRHPSRLKSVMPCCLYFPTNAEVSLHEWGWWCSSSCHGGFTITSETDHSSTAGCLNSVQRLDACIEDDWLANYFPFMHWQREKVEILQIPSIEESDANVEVVHSTCVAWNLNQFIVPIGTIANQCDGKRPALIYT